MEAPLAPAATRDFDTPRLALVIGLLWLAGVGLRVTVLAIPPLLPQIHRDLGLTETGIGFLSSIPSMMFALAAVPGSLLIWRFGALRILIAGLAIAALASAARAEVTDELSLDLMTIAMGFGISIMQPALPPLVRAWTPRRIGFVTAVYSNGWLMGEIFAVWLTIPYVLPLFDGSWRLSLASWSAPVLATAALFALFAPRSGPGAPHTSAPPRRWWPNWFDGLVWRIGLVMGGANLAYWASNGFIPDYLTQSGRPELIGGALTALNVGQLPISLVMLAAAGRIAGRAWPFVALGAVMLAGVAGLMTLDGIALEFAAGMIGFACAGVLILSLTIPPLVCAHDDVPRTMAATFTIGYACSLVVPVIGGALWDATGSPHAAFALVAAGAAGVILLPRGIAAHRHTSEAGS